MTLFHFKSTLAVTLLVVVSSSSKFAIAFVSPQPLHPLKAAVETYHRPLVARTARRTEITSLSLLGFEIAAKDGLKGLQEGELAKFQYIVPAKDKAHVKFDSLSTMINQWSELFADGKVMGLTTDVKVSQLPARGDSDAASSSSGVKLVFKKRNAAYSRKAAYSDADAAKDDDKSDEPRKKKDKTVREGGVQVVVTLLESDELQVTASRCDIDEGTIVKEMSEETIIDSLRKAIAAWKKEQLRA